MFSSNLKTPHLAAISVDRIGGVDDLLASFALALRDRGWWVRGVIESTMYRQGEGTYPCVVDLDSGVSYQLPHCHRKTMSGALTIGHEVSILFRQIVCEGADLVLINRFSGDEAQGKGIAAEMMMLAEAGIPILTVVQRPDFLAWTAFAGESGIILPPKLEQLNDWVFSVWRDASCGTSPTLSELKYHAEILSKVP